MANMNSLVLSLLIYSLNLAPLASATTACYWTNGDLATYLVPCQPSQAISPCCGGTDYCTSSGLCINADGDNMFSIQGCTSRGWEEPCQSYCGPGTMIRKMWQCQGVPDTKKMKYCCGESAACCSNDTNTFEVPVATQIYRALGSSSSPSSSSSTSSQSDAKLDGTSVAELDRLKKVQLGLGVGLGVPLGLMVIAALAYLALGQRKRRVVLGHNGETSGPNASVKQHWRSLRDIFTVTVRHGSLYREDSKAEARELDHRNVIHEIGAR